MADTAVAITAGSGTNIDTRTEGTNGNHRQVIVIGDPATNNSVAAVMAASTAPAATDPALVVAISPNTQNANGQATKANSTPVTIASDDNTTVSLALIDDVIFTDDAAFTSATSKVAVIGFQADETSTDSVDEGDAGAARMTLDRKQIVTTQPHTQGGASVLRKIDLDETPVAIKASRGQVYGFYIVNRTTSPRYLRIYNVASGSVTVGTTAPLMGPIEIPANASDHTAFVVNFPYGIEFDTAISMAATTGFADNDTGAPGSNDLLANVFYK